VSLSYYETGLAILLPTLLTCYQLIRTRQAAKSKERTQIINDLEGDYEEFISILLDWYTAIIDFVSPLVLSNKRGIAVSPRQRSEYLDALEALKKRDQFTTKCRRFVSLKVPVYLERLHDAELRSTLSRTVELYQLSEVSIWYFKDILGRFLQGDSVHISDVEKAISQIATYKDELAKVGFPIKKGKQ